MARPNHTPYTNISRFTPPSASGSQPTVSFYFFVHPQAGVECTKEYLEGSEGKQEVLSEYQRGIQTLGISGVPHFVISREGSNATVPLSGGQPPAAFMQAFEALS